MKDQLKKYGDSRTFCKSKSPLSGRGGNISSGYDVWKLSSNWRQEELKAIIMSNEKDGIFILFSLFSQKKKKKESDKLNYNQ